MSFGYFLVRACRKAKIRNLLLFTMLAVIVWMITVVAVT
jgi:hypothetical protein